MTGHSWGTAWVLRTYKASTMFDRLAPQQCIPLQWLAGWLECTEAPFQWNSLEELHFVKNPYRICLVVLCAYVQPLGRRCLKVYVVIVTLITGTQNTVNGRICWTRRGTACDAVIRSGCWDKDGTFFLKTTVMYSIRLRCSGATVPLPMPIPSTDPIPGCVFVGAIPGKIDGIIHFMVFQI